MLLLYITFCDLSRDFFIFVHNSCEKTGLFFMRRYGIISAERRRGKRVSLPPLSQLRLPPPRAAIVAFTIARKDSCR